MAQLVHKKKTILKEMDYRTSLFGISFGLMFNLKSKAKKGVCLVMPADKDVKFGASVTMWFVFYSLEILFVNSKGKVVDKVVLKPWKGSYTPKAECKYVIESTVGRFKDVKEGDKVEIKLV